MNIKNILNIIKNSDNVKLLSMFRKYSVKFVKANNHLWFLSRVRKEGVTPKFVKIYTKSTSRSAQKAIEAAKKIWIEEERKSWFAKRDNISEVKYLIQRELHGRFSHKEEEYKDYSRHVAEINEFVNKTGHRQYVNQKKKLETLVQNQVVNNTLPVITSQLLSLNITGVVEKSQADRFPIYDIRHDFYPRFKNLSSLYFTPAEEEVLNLGFKHAFESKMGDSDLLDLTADCEVALTTQSVSFANEKRNCKSIINKLVERNSKFKRSVHLQVLKSIKTKIDNDQLVICKADKGNTVTVLPRDEYQDKIGEYISENNLVPTREKNILGKYVAQVTRCIAKCPKILVNLSNVVNPQIPVLYGLPKLHKSGEPLRPVVSCTNAPNVELCKRLTEILPGFLNFKPKHTIKNSLEFIERTKKLTIPPNAKLISFDVKSLFPSVPVNEVKDIIRSRISSQSQLVQRELLHAVDICLDQNFCSFNGTTYEIKSGLPIGSPVSPLMAEIFMEQMEEKILGLEDPLIATILHWFRYVDDIFVVTTATTRQIDKLLNLINSIHSNLKFTVELEVDNRLNFLDLSVTRLGSSLEFDIYRKPTFTDCVIGKSSNVPNNIKYASFHSMLHRLISIPLSLDNYLKELGKIHTIARNNGYTIGEINNLLLKKLRKQKRERIYARIPKDGNDNWRKLRYGNKDCIKIGNELRKVGIQPAFYNDRTIGNYLINNKPKIGKELKSGIYSIKCNDCDSTYVGMTQRALQTRISEHLKRPLSHVNQHMAEQGHSFTMDNVSLLHRGHKKWKLSCLEMLYIKEASKNNTVLLNGQLTPAYYSPLLQ
uniref:Reverse transcriptase domain-containing protein n=2 Tax=Cacopsylla melanoneura TaxID=428564 RepID=A0A8D8YVM4_9HEMI